jgi:hypothetical protein
MPPLFEFQLTALGRVVPWGGSDNPNLHWFGLSDGSYWMNVGEAKLFEYSGAAQALGAPRFCDYQVARLFEDVLEIAPYVLEEVPRELRAFIEFEVDRPWDNPWHAWRDLPGSLVADDEHADLLEFGATWLGQRTLDSLYLSPPANIRMWSDAKNVYIQWDNRKRQFDNKPTWSATAGTHALSREAFVDEVLSFHARFMSEMGHRVERVIAGELPSSIRIDLDGLVREQRERSASADRNVLVRSPGTDWARVRKAIARLEELRSET